LDLEEALSELKVIVETVQKQEEWRGRSTLNLIASENKMSPLARALLPSDFNHRYAEGEPYDREYQGGGLIDLIEDLCIKLASRVFNANFVDVRPISGALANLAVFFALTKPGDVLLSLSIPAGGHISCGEVGAAGCRGLKVYSIPFNHEDMNIDLEALASVVEKAKPNLITLGASLILFPHPVKEIRKIAEPYGTLIHYDAAHVLGLVAGGVFQDPLKEGADVVSSSTHKTFPGPQGGMLLANDETLFRKVKKAVFPGLVSNHHLARLPSLAVTLLEMLLYGKEYATQIVRNAKTLAKALHDYGINVLGAHRGFTESHQVVFEASKLGGGGEAARRLEEADIIVNRNLLPWDAVGKVHNPSGVRIGTQEVTRMGMKEREMETIAELMWRLLIKREEPERIKEEVHKLLADFNTVRYCIDGQDFVKGVLKAFFER